MGSGIFNNERDNSPNSSRGIDEAVYKYRLRAVAGIILLVLAIFFLYLSEDQKAIEYIMLALAGFLVGGSIFENITWKK